MAMVLTGEQELLRDSARDFLRTVAPLSHLRELRDSDHPQGFSADTWASMVEMGWAAMIIPEGYGGLDFGYTGLGLVLEETGRTLSPCPLISSVLLGTTALLRSGAEALCSAYLEKVAAGDTLLALACEESVQYRPRQVDTTASRQAGSIVLNGVKINVIDGHAADYLVVSAREEDGAVLCLVPTDADGLEIEPSRLVDGRFTATARFCNVRIDEAQVLESGERATVILELTLDIGRVGLAAEMLGIAQECFERTLSYLKERKQFGVAIGSFQALQHRCAVLYGEIELSKSVVLRALHAIDEESDDLPLLASLAKARAGDTARLATAEAIQMHGGIGMTDEFDIGFFIKRCRVLEQTLGDSHYHADRFARLRGY